MYSPWDNEKSLLTWYLPIYWVCSLLLALLSDHLWTVRSSFPVRQPEGKLLCSTLTVALVNRHLSHVASVVGGGIFFYSLPGSLKQNRWLRRLQISVCAGFTTSLSTPSRCTIYVNSTPPRMHVPLAVPTFFWCVCVCVFFMSIAVSKYMSVENWEDGIRTAGGTFQMACSW